MTRGAVDLEALYATYFPKIYNYVFYRLLHREKAEDLTSLIFLKIAEHLDSYDPKKAKLSTWIWRIAENTLCDYYRTNKIHLSLDDDTCDIKSSMAVGFEEQYEQILSPKRKDLFAALCQMNERDRMLIYMKYILDMSYREISKQLGMNESTLASALMRAKQKLKKQLKNGPETSLL